MMELKECALENTAVKTIPEEKKAHWNFISGPPEGLDVKNY